MDPRHLRQLAEIIDQGSFARAAETSGIPQSTLSRNIKSLEAHIGAPVLERGRFGVTATQIGFALAREGRRIRESVVQAETEHRLWRQSLEGRLRLGAGTMIAHSMIGHFLTDPLYTEWNVALKIDVSAASLLLDRLKNGELDLAVTQIDPLFAQQGLQVETIIEETLGFYVSSNHPLANAKRITIADLAPYPYLALEAFGNEIADLFGSAGYEPPTPKTSFSGDVSMILHLLSQGRHYSVFPDFLMRHRCDDRSITRLDLPVRSPKRIIALSVHQDLAGHPLIEAFRRRLTAFVKSLN